MSTDPYIPAQHGFYCDAGGFPYRSLMPDFITLIENLPKIDRYHTSSIGNINTAQSLAISKKIILKVMYLDNIIMHSFIGQMCVSKIEFTVLYTRQIITLFFCHPYFH